jgi:hypothetical protein
LLRWTNQQKRGWQCYEPGQVVTFVLGRNRPTSSATVVRVERKKVVLALAFRKEIVLDLRRPDSFGVSRPRQIEVTSGDKILFRAKTPEMKIVGKQTANWKRNEAIDLMNNLLVAGTNIEAVAANNDEMAIGAILALQQAGKDPKKLVIGGIDATQDALREMERGNLAVTVFQDPKAQGRGAVETAVKLTKGEQVDSFVWIPFQLVTRDNDKEFLTK